MAPFRKDDVVNDELEYDLPFRLIQNSPLALYTGRENFEGDIQDLRSRGFVVPYFDCRTWTTEAVLHNALRVGLKLPDYTGQNFDALDDSLTDIEVPEATGFMVALDNVTDAPRADVLLDVLARASRYWLLFGRIFGVLARTDRPELAPAQIGAMRPARQWELPN